MISVTSLFFGFYLLITVPLYWVLPAKWRNQFLLMTSLVLLGLTSLKLLVLIGLLSIFTYWLGKSIHNGERGKPAFIMGIVIVAGVLAYYKYTPMVIENLNLASGLLRHPFSLRVPELVVPVGISFFTFKLIHYLIACYKKESPVGDFRQYLLYVAFFPIFTSGPIERWPHFSAQKPALTSSQIFSGFTRIVTGLIKKKVLADNLVIFANALQVPNVSSWGYWIAAYAYAFQIYWDFSGYSDIAIGSARLFGYEIMENFNWPYLQRNLSLFWKNWHITLTGWFIEYIFIPLGGSRVSFPRILFNTLVVMAVTGIWHGAAWHFMGWGLFHGLGLIAWRIYGMTIGKKIGSRWGDSLPVKIISTFITFHYVVLGWVFFATGIRQSLHVVAKMLFLQ